MSERRRTLMAIVNQFKWLPYSFEYLYHSLIPTTLPKNIFDGELEVGGTNSGLPYPSTQFIRSVNFIPVKSGTSYTITTDITPFSRFYFEQYDESKTYIGETSSSSGILTLGDTTKYIKFLIYGGGSDYTSVPINNTYVSITNVSVNVRNKAKLTKIYGESAVVNQLVQNGNFEDGTTNFTFEALDNISVSSNVFSATATNTGFRINQSVNLVANHKYLVMYDFELVSIAGSNSNRYVGCADSNDYFPQSTIEMKKMGDSLGKYRCAVITYSTTTGSTTLRIVRGLSFIVGDTFKVSNMMFIDLTQAYPFNTPTTLTDNRIQNILNNGYIPYNTGTIENTDIGEFSSEPYNLFDGELEQGRYDLNSGLPVVGYVGYYRSKNKIKVVGGQTYTISRSETTLGYLYEYDINNNFLGNTYISTNTTNDFVLKQNTAYINISLGSSLTSEPTQVCLHQTGTRTGYAPHTNISNLPFVYQGSGVGTSKDSVEIGKENVVFTKNNARVDLGSLSYNYNNSAGHERFYANIPNEQKPKFVNDSTLHNLICEKYTNETWNNMYNHTIDKCCAFSTVGSYIDIFIYDSAYTDPTTFKSAMSGVMLEYQLATPQTITIPRKHLVVKRIRDLSWSYQSDNKRFYATISGVKSLSDTTIVPNMYCSQLLTRKFDFNQNTNYLCIGQFLTQVYLQDLSCSNTTDLLAKYGDQFIFYETANETTDIADKLDIEAGGSLNSYWFEWVENQLVANGDFSNGTTGWSSTNATISASNNKLTMLATAQNGYANMTDRYSVIANHKYLISVKIKLTTGTTQIRIRGFAGYGDFYTQNTTNWQYLSNIATPTENLNGYVAISDMRSSGWDNIEIADVQVIDLTLAGIDTTNINDYRVQAILKKGYLPQNTTGTLTYEQNEVLGDIDFSFKCK